MDINELWDYIQPQTPSPASQDQMIEETTSLSTFPSICPNELENILNSLFQGENTTENYTNKPTVCSVDNNDYDMDSGYANQIYSHNDIALDFHYNNLQDNAGHGDLEPPSTSSFNRHEPSSFFSDISNAFFPTESNMPSYSSLNANRSTQSPAGTSDNFRRVERASQISSPNDIPKNFQYNNSQSNTVYGNVDELSPSPFSGYTTSSFSSDIYNASLPLTSNIPSYSPLNAHCSTQCAGTSNNFKRVGRASQIESTNTYQSNNTNRKDRGYKQILSLCTNTSTVKEPWQPKVAKRILSAYYAPLYLKSAFLATQIALDEFQSLVMKEAVSAFHDIVFLETVPYEKGRNEENSCPGIFMKSCDEVRAYKRLLPKDKVTLLSSIFFDAIALKSVITYDKLTDSWNCSNRNLKRKDVFRMDASLHNGIVRVIETFPDRWRKDLTVISLLYLIIIFNPDLPDLKFEEAIRLEQYTYIYLLQRYLEVTCKSPCEASDYHYRLMAKIADIRNLRQQMQYFFQMFIIDFSLSECILESVGYTTSSSRKLSKN